jgi:hypothetical protein
MLSKNPTAFESIRSWVSEITGEKAAAARGETTHPSKNVDDGTMSPREGERARENVADVKKMIPAGGVDSAAANPAGSAETQHYQIGTRKSEAGGDPSVEDNYTDKPRVTEKTPTTLTQAKGDVGEKYSYDLTTPEGIRAAIKLAGDLANEVMAATAVAAAAPVSAPEVPKQANSSPPVAPPAPGQAQVAPPAATSETKPASDPPPATPTGDALAAALGLSKEAADAAAQTILQEILRDAEEMAVKTAGYIYQIMQATKDESTQPKQADAAVPPPTEPPAGAPVPPPAAIPAPAPEAGTAGPDHEKALQELVMALLELGISPEELAQLAQAGPGEGAGGAPPVPPPEGSPADLGPKLASAIKDYQRSGRFHVTEAKEGSPERKYRDELKGYISEIVKAGRR